MSEPCFFVEDKNGYVLVARNTSENLERLRSLRLNIEVEGHGNNLLARGGDISTSNRYLSPYRFGGSFLRGDGCFSCLFQSGCPGPTAHIADKFRGQRNTVESMTMSIGANKPCPMVSENPESPTWPTKSDLKSAGFDPMHQITRFIEYGDWEEAVELSRSGVDPKEVINDPIGVDALSQSLAVNKDSTDMMVHGFNFSRDVVDGNAYISRVRGAIMAKKKGDIKSFRESHCNDCVYACPKTPWNLDRECGLSIEDVMLDFDEDRDPERLAVMTTMGNRFKMGNTNYIGTTLLRGAVRITRLIPPYSHRLIEVDEYLELADVKPDLKEHDPKILAPAAYVLHRLVQHDEYRFYGHASYPSRNDILYWRLSSDATEIVVGSDSRATKHGGMYMRGGSHIGIYERPRFRTTFEWPFFEDVFTYLEENPGSKGRGRSK